MKSYIKIYGLPIEKAVINLLVSDSEQQTLSNFDIQTLAKASEININKT